jgi:hypothetical protein
MTNSEKLTLNSDIDIVNARMAVREFARHAGLSLTDQACISMAASSLAYSLGLGRESSQGGEMLIEQHSNHQRSGVRVRCIKNQAVEADRDVVNHLGNSRWLVDDIELKPCLESGLEVSVIKWDSQHR